MKSKITWDFHALAAAGVGLVAVYEWLVKNPLVVAWLHQHPGLHLLVQAIPVGLVPALTYYKAAR